MLNVVELMNKNLDEQKETASSLTKAIHNLEAERDAKIMASKKQITQEYNEKIKLRSLKIDAIMEAERGLGQKCVQMSFFDASVIGDILSTIVTFYEGMPYSYQKFEFKEYIRWNNQELINNMHVICDSAALKILRESVIGKTFDEENNPLASIFGNLLEQRKIIILKRSYSFLDKINFVVEDITHRVDSAVDFTEFPYLEEFMDEVLQFKIVNGYETVSSDTLKNMQKEFLRRNREQIEQSYMIRNNEDKMRIASLKRRKQVQGEVLQEFGDYLAKR